MATGLPRLRVLCSLLCIHACLGFLHLQHGSLCHQRARPAFPLIRRVPIPASSPQPVTSRSGLFTKEMVALSSAACEGATRPPKGLLLKAYTVLGKSTRWAVAGLVGLTLLLRRDAPMVNFTAGAILNAFLGKTLKRIIKEERPDGAQLEDHGMPSSHAMSLFYMTTYLIAVLSRFGVPSWWPVTYLPTILTLLAYVFTASSWRVHSGLHTSAQILVGAVGGGTVGLVWERLAHLRLNPWLNEVLKGIDPQKGQVPLPYVLSVMVVGALTVGSVERTIGKLVKLIKGGKEKP